MTPTDTLCDVLIVGGGPAGAASALALRQRGLSVILLERSNDAVQGTEAPGRALGVGESISALAQFPLRELGLWDDFLRQPSRGTWLTQSAWGSNTLQEKRAIHTGLGPDLHVHRLRFDAWLRSHARQHGAVVRCDTRIDDVVFQASVRRFRLRVRDSGGNRRELEAPYMIDASGRSAWLMRKLGATTDTTDDLMCLGRPLQDVSFEPSILVESTPDGWWYSAPSPDGAGIALFMTYPTLHKPLRRQQVWDTALASAPRTRARLAHVREIGLLRVCSAGPALTRWDANQPCLAVGDAAAAFDPISGSGVCFALRSALEAAHAVASAQRGAGALFDAYQRGVRRVFAQHLERRHLIYRSEMRWNTEPFWAEAGKPRAPDVVAWGQVLDGPLRDRVQNA